MSVSRSKITGYGRRKNRSRSNVHIHIYCQPELANQIASSSLSPQKSSQLPKKKQLQTEKTALWMASFWYRLLLATVMGYQTSHNPGRQPVHVVTEACWMGSLEKPDDSTYGVYIHIATYILFIYYSYHIYIYTLFLSCCILLFLGRPKITISNLRQKTNQQRRTSQPPPSFFGNRWIDSVEESEESAFESPKKTQSRTLPAPKASPKSW